MTNDSKLRQPLAAKLGAAHRERGKHHGAQLGNGLHLSVYITPEGVVHLLMWRQKIRPAGHEWITVMRHWPWPLPSPWPVPDPVDSREGGRQGLKSAWPVKPTF